MTLWWGEGGGGAAWNHLGRVLIVTLFSKSMQLLSLYLRFREFNLVDLPHLSYLLLWMFCEKVIQG